MSAFDDLDLEPPEARRAGRRAAARERLARLHDRVDRPTRVLLRDFAIFEVKLLLDGLKGIVISQAAIVALIADLVLHRHGGPTGWFYRVLRLGERADLWLNLYGSTRGAADNPEGLFGESRAGSSTLLGQLERLADRFIVGEEGDQGRDAAPPHEPAEEAPPDEPRGAAPAKDAAPGEAPSEGAPSEGAASDEGPSEGALAGEALSEEARPGGASPGDALSREALSRDAPPREVPAAEAPAAEAPPEADSAPEPAV